MEKEEVQEVYLKIPVLPLRGLVVFPKMMLHFDVSRKQSLRAVKEAMSSDQKIFLVAQMDPAINEPSLDDLYGVGIIAKILQLVKQSDGVTRVVIEGEQRAFIDENLSTDEFLCASVLPIATQPIKDSGKEMALRRSIKRIYEEYVELMPNIPSDILFKIAMSTNTEDMADMISANIVVDYRQKQKLLSPTSLQRRLEYLLQLLNSEVYILKIENEINEKAGKRIDERQKEYLLREKMQIIREELGEDDSPESEAEEYAYMISKLKLSDEVRQSLQKECCKLSKMPYGSQEATVIRNYLDICIDLPWNKYSKEKIDIKKVRASLDKEHYGLKKVKERILEQLAVRKNSPNAKAQILCLVGPPGVGKTSIAMSVAKAINRKCARISLGGVRDEAEIRGHRKTYLGSMPGRIISAVKQAGTSNCILILDEIDKLGNDYKGDPSSALLEVLDTEQNYAFHDHYLDLPFDLSKIMFITTANDASAIPAPLLDRMELIELESYTREEKFQIARRHLIPKQMKNCSLTAKQIKLTDDAVYALIDFYTKEAGVRNLERTISSVISKSLLNMLENEIKSVKVSAEDLKKLLGPKKFLDAPLQRKDEVGLANGLAWTSAGGELLPIEVAVMEGTGKLVLTGSLGDVMQESAKTAVTCIRAHADELGIDSGFYKNRDIHIHAPEGAVPKDGPSAGITMATALFSALSGKPVRHDIAMTGEITLRGAVLPIGGLKEKSMAAFKNGIKTVLIPAENARDLSEIDSTVSEALSFVPVDNILQVLNTAVRNGEKPDGFSGKYIFATDRVASGLTDTASR